MITLRASISYKKHKAQNTCTRHRATFIREAIHTHKYDPYSLNTLFGTQEHMQMSPVAYVRIIAQPYSSTNRHTHMHVHTGTHTYARMHTAHKLAYIMNTSINKKIISHAHTQ